MPVSVVKINNHRGGRKAKIEIRERVLEALTPEGAVVFDAFAGAGLMWREVWRRAAGYIGCDEEWHRDERCCYAADNRRVLRCIDLSPFTVFDLDAYGSPWEQALIIAARRRPMAVGERLGLVFTEGSYLRMRFSKVPRAMRLAAGVMPAVEFGAGHMHDALIGRAVSGIARRMHGRVVKEWRALGVTSSHVHYVAVILEGVPHVDDPPRTPPRAGRVSRRAAAPPAVAAPPGTSDVPT
jgi:hypothetical protein